MISEFKWTKVVLPPVFLEEELPISDAASSTVFKARNQVSDILAGRDPRLLVVVGPCSIHDTKAAREYAALLKPLMEELAQSLCIVMRVYFEKPRTTDRLEGPDQRPAPQPDLQDQRRPAYRAPSPARSGRDGCPRGHGIPRHHLAAIFR